MDTIAIRMSNVPKPANNAARDPNCRRPWTGEATSVSSFLSIMWLATLCLQFTQRCRYGKASKPNAQVGGLPAYGALWVSQLWSEEKFGFIPDLPLKAKH